ncbi:MULTISPECIES: hypothetical protein [Halolamina]|uniref:Uncharacterized protein n=2 Tax=Halolamina TaxID=1075397 RepID=A0A1I5VQH1_9EURY|nr:MULTISPECIES: hypothetical protein [Halolamina]NHX37823.1 hypothetical protein [Halolamina sp. R1-12]SFQ09700.1 hypothetical protein SAMN05216277_11930 [Halolamina pelagica]
MASEDLHKPLKAINQSISDLREDIISLKGEVEKIHTVIRQAAETIREAIQENIRAQAELKLMDHIMEVRTVKPQINAEYEQIETERSELQERLTSIEERYQRKHEELNEKAKDRIRNLGSHIFEIDEEQFESGIEDPFTSQVTTTWQFLQAHNEDVRTERTGEVQGTTEEVVQTIDDFVHRQDELIETIDDHRFDAAEVPLPDDHPERLQVPYYIVEYESDGFSQRRLVVPSELSTENGTTWCSISLSPISGSGELLSGVSGVDNPETIGSISADQLASTLGEYGKESWVTSYSDAVTDAVPEDGTIPVRAPGGED